MDVLKGEIIVYRIEYLSFQQVTQTSFNLFNLKLIPMKKILFMLVLLCGVVAFTACSDNDNEEDPTPICPVTNVKADKTTAKVGDQVTLTGKGFATDAKLYLKNTTETEIPGVSITSDGTSVTFIVPEVEEGSYQFILVQNGKWTLELTLNIEKKIVVKKIDTFGLNVFPALNFKFNYTEDGKVSSITQTEEGKDPYEYHIFRYSQDSIYITTDQSGTFPRDQGSVTYEDNQIKSCNGNTWTYTPEGYLQKAITGTRLTETHTYTYDQNKLIKWSNEYMGSTTEFTLSYEGDRPEIQGANIGALLSLILGGGYSSFAFATHLMDLCGEIPTQLPSAIKGMNNIQGAEATSPITDYTVDEDNFITKIVLNDQIRFNKELILTFTWK